MRFVYIFAFILFFTYCGQGREETEYRYPDNNASDPIVPGDDSSPTLPIAVNSIQRSCGPCHGNSQNPLLRNEAEVLKNLSRICARVSEGSMPPGGNISKSDKDAILGECK